MTTDHFGLAVDRMAAGADVRETLDLAYECRPKDPVLIAQLNDHLRHNMAMARLHAELAQVQVFKQQVQATNDLRASVDQIHQWLTTDDDIPPIRLVDGDVVPIRGDQS
jgi:hypothetical protein